MLMVISPAKALNFAPAAGDFPATRPQFTADTAELAAVASKLSARKLKSLMGISQPLAELNFTRFQAFDIDSQEGMQAVFAFNGDVYAGLMARKMDRASLGWAQAHLRILSGLYGLLRPLDVIQPYRLEMGSRLKTRRGANLCDFWGGKIATRLSEEAKTHQDPTLVNIASHEYFAAVDMTALTIPAVSCHFKYERDGELKPLGFSAKKARGALARYAIENRSEKAGDLKSFDRDGFSFRPAASSDTDWVFARARS